MKHHLHSTHVIANHILVSFHVAFISSLLNIPSDLYGPGVLKFVFGSYETVISACFWLITFHTGVALHEMGHYLRAVKVSALRDDLQLEAKKNSRMPIVARAIWYLRMFLAIPYGAFKGVRKEGLTYYPEAPFNLSVAAAGPQISRSLAFVMLPAAFVLLFFGLAAAHDTAIYVGRLCLGMGCVGLLDFLLADPGKLREFRMREKVAARKAKQSGVEEDSWRQTARRIKETMRDRRMQGITLLNGEEVRAPWQFRNCGMGGRHTEKEYPESNISMQEMMFIPLCARDYEEAQMITVTLQNRLKEIIEKEEGARVMGIGLEGGLAPYVSKGTNDAVPEQRLWRMAVQAIKDSGFTPGKDVAIALDPAVSELSHAHREEFKQSDSVGTYYFWRGEEKVVMSREQMLDLYKGTLNDIPIISLEDAFAEDDHEGWRLLMEELGDTVFVIGDDLVTTNDAAIEDAADKKLINTALIKANQIGTLSETMLAILTALGKGLDIVVSHRSKSPNDDMEAQIALATNALGLKTGGGANTERLFKYGAVTKIMKDIARLKGKSRTDKTTAPLRRAVEDLIITDVIAYEEPTNAGIPTVGVEVHAGVKNSIAFRKFLRFTGATPLGTSAGVGEAIHLIDSIIECKAVVERHHQFFTEQSDKTYRFGRHVTERDVKKTEDSELLALWNKAQRYGGKGCQNAVNGVTGTIARAFVGKQVKMLQGIIDIDRKLLTLEFRLALERGKVSEKASMADRIAIMQRKGNLGMNAILSMSLALARLVAHVEGKDLWQILREEMKALLARVILSSGNPVTVAETLGAVAAEKIGSKKATPERVCVALHFDELVVGLRIIEKKLREKGMRLHPLLREHMAVYQI